MIYETALTLEPNMTEADMESESLPVHPGTVQQVSIEIPEGCAGLVYVRIYLWERQLWPSNPGGAFSGDNLLLVFPEDLQLRDQPFEFSLRGWNTDDTYSHTVRLRVQMKPFSGEFSTPAERGITGGIGPIVIWED